MARKRRSQSATVRRRSRNKPFLKAMRHIHEYERVIILRDCEAMTSGGNVEISARRLRLFAPMRYSPKLPGALERLAKERWLTVVGYPGRGPTYRLADDDARERRERLLRGEAA